MSLESFAQEVIYEPYSQMLFVTGNEKREFSGVAIESPEDEIRVLTCWHATEGFTAPKVVTAQFFDSQQDTRLSAIFDMQVKKLNSDKDIMLVSTKNTRKIKIKKLKIGRAQLNVGDVGTSYGYSGSINLISNKGSVSNIVPTTNGGNKILRVNIRPISGMSGGPFIIKEEVYGIQSSGRDNYVDYCPADQLLEFVK